jgi:hypothetical protein
MKHFFKREHEENTNKHYCYLSYENQEKFKLTFEKHLKNVIYPINVVLFFL